MHTNPRIRALSLTAAVALAVTAFSAAPAVASGDSVLRADLVGSMPAPDSPAIAGINPGVAPWMNGPSSVRVREDGRIRVKIRGLVIPGRGNPVSSVVATLVCDVMVADLTDPFALDAVGNGRARDTIMVPDDCDDPAVLIQPAGNRTVYIASAMDDHDD